MAKAGPSSADNQFVTGPSFRFRLERVRALRERREQIAQEELAHSISRLGDSQAELAGAEAELMRALAEQRRVSSEPGTVGGEELLARQAFLERMEAEQSQRQSLLAHSEAEVADRSAKLAVAAGEHEMLLRLRERRRGEHAREQARIESNANDEIAAVRFGRSRA